METLSTPTEIKAAWDQLLSEEPRLRIRNAAHKLGLSEAELLATRCGKGVTRLVANCRNILAEVHNLGYVMALTRNNEVVHERKGIYNNASLKSPVVGLFVNEDIDLRIFWEAWHFSYAVVDTIKDKKRRSLQFFDQHGTAVHKIYLTPKSDLEAWEALVKKFQVMDQSQFQPVSLVPAPKPDLPDDEIDHQGFRQAWIDLQDTHDFFGLLRKYKVGRKQAMRLAPEGFAIPLGKLAFRRAIELASQRTVPIMVFVGNRGMIQIHTGPVKKLLDHGTWFNVMDPAFNLHLNEELIDSIWLVRKPTKDGTVSSIEVFNAKGDMMVQLFGKRKPGIPELPEWRDLLVALETNQALVKA